MDKIAWPSHIKFDDTETDMMEARRYLLEINGVGEVGGFLDFIHAYAREVEVRRSASFAEMRDTA